MSNAIQPESGIEGEAPQQRQAKPEAPWTYQSPANAWPRWIDNVWPGELNEAADVLRWTQELHDEAQAKAEEIAKNTHLTKEGKAAAWTKYAVERLGSAHKQLAVLDRMDGVVSTEADRLANTTIAEPQLTPDVRLVRLEQAKAFGQLSKQDRAQYLEAAMTGKDPELQEPLALMPEIVSKVGGNVREQIRSQLYAKRRDLPAESANQAKARLLSDIRKAAREHIAAVEDAAHRPTLKQAGATTGLRRSDMKTDEKSAYISKHGLAAFQALPA